MSKIRIRRGAGEVKIQFLGAAGTVTGSCFMLFNEKHQVSRGLAVCFKL